MTKLSQARSATLKKYNRFLEGALNDEPFHLQVHNCMFCDLYKIELGYPQCGGCPISKAEEPGSPRVDYRCQDIIQKIQDDRRDGDGVPVILAVLVYLWGFEDA